MATATQLLTAEEQARLPDRGVPTELVRGEVIELNQPFPRQAQVCNRIGRIVGDDADEHDLGQVLSNDAGIVTERHPDTVRGGDVSFISYAKVPKGPLPNDDLPAPPELVFDVLSEHERWPNVLAKVAEYLQIGVEVVWIVDPRQATVRLYFADEPEIVLRGDDALTFPKQLPGFAVRVKRLFE